MLKMLEAKYYLISNMGITIIILVNNLEILRGLGPQVICTNNIIQSGPHIFLANLYIYIIHLYFSYNLPQIIVYTVNYL